MSWRVVTTKTGSVFIMQGAADAIASVFGTKVTKDELDLERMKRAAMMAASPDMFKALSEIREAIRLGLPCDTYLEYVNAVLQKANPLERIKK